MERDFPWKSHFCVKVFFSDLLKRYIEIKLNRQYLQILQVCARWVTEFISMGLFLAKLTYPNFKFKMALWSVYGLITQRRQNWCAKSKRRKSHDKNMQNLAYLCGSTFARWNLWLVIGRIWGKGARAFLRSSLPQLNSRKQLITRPDRKKNAPHSVKKHSKINRGFEVTIPI